MEISWSETHFDLMEATSLRVSSIWVLALTILTVIQGEVKRVTNYQTPCSGDGFCRVIMT
jgi:hypothetical protein